MPKNPQSSNAASRHALRRNQVSNALKPLTLFCRAQQPSFPFTGLSYLSQAEAGIVFSITPPFSLTIAFRGAMLHALTVPPASSTSDRLYSPPLNLTFWQAMAGSA